MTQSFRDKVYEVVGFVPRGRVATYGQIATLAGNPRAARAVGMCMKTNPNIPSVPCHRVVASDGCLTGYSGKGGIKTKRKLLLEEGVPFIDDKVDIKSALWHEG